MKFVKLLAVIFLMATAVAAQTNMGPVSIAGGTVINNSTNLAQTGQPNTFAAGMAQTGQFNSVLNATQYASGSNTCGIAEAYAAGPSTGVPMVMSADCTMSSAQTITTAVQKPLYLNGQGHTITCTHTSGICLTLIKPDSTPRTSVVVGNLHIVYGGVSTNVTGVKLGAQANSLTDVVFMNVDISKFNTTSATALELDNAEDCHFYSTKLNGNALALKLDKSTNNNQFFGTNIQGGVQAISMTDASGNNFIGGLIQSNTGTRTVTQTSSTQAVVGNTFQNVWFENNGDTTANARVFYNFASGAVHNIFAFASLNNTINAGSAGAAGKVYEFTGDSTSAAISPVLKGNSYGGYGSNIITGSFVFPTSVEGESATFADVGMNLGGVTGLHFWPQTGAHHYQMYAGDSAQMGGSNNLFIKDLTAGTTPLQYSASGTFWTMPGLIVNGGIVGNNIQIQGGTTGGTLVVAQPTASGTLTLPSATDTLVGKATTDTLTNKTLTNPTIAFILNSGTLTLPTATGTLGDVIASGTSTFTTTAVAAGTCQTTVTTAATNALTTDVIIWDYASGPLTAATDGMLIIQKYVTANNVNFQRCNPTAASITPTALSVIWKVIR